MNHSELKQTDAELKRKTMPDPGSSHCYPTFENECQNNPPHQPPLDLRRDDIVNVREDDGSVTIQTVKYEPWQLGDGTWVVGLFGRGGGFLLSRVTLNRRGRA